MCLYDPEWYWGDSIPTVWQPGMKTCCRPTRTVGEPGVLFIEEIMDDDRDLCPICEGEEAAQAGDDYGDPVDQFPYIKDTSPFRILFTGRMDDYGNWIPYRRLGRCLRCDGDGLVDPRPPRQEWMCGKCVEVARWLNVICGGEYGSGSGVVPQQVLDHWDDGWGGHAAAVLATAGQRGWETMSLAMLRSFVDDAIRHDQATGYLPVWG